MARREKLQTYLYRDCSALKTDGVKKKNYTDKYTDLKLEKKSRKLPKI